MPLVNIKRPKLIGNVGLKEMLLWSKHTTDNIDRLNRHWSALPDDYSTFTHGVALEVPNPFSPSLPSGFVATAAEDEDGEPVPTPVSWTFTPSQREGWVGLTLYFELNHAQPCLIKTLASNDSLTNNVAAAIDTWNTDANAEVNRGGVISETGGTFTVSEAGLYLISFHLVLEASVTYTQVQANIDSVGNPRWRDFLAASMTDGPRKVATAQLELAAGGTFECTGFQTNAGPSTRAVLSGANNTRVAVSRLYNGSTPSARVVGYLIGP